MNTYLIDFETTFSSDHTLTRHSIEEYVRHPKFEVIGCGVECLETGEQTWHPSGPQLAGVLARLAIDSAFVAHHAQFDGFVLNHVFGAKPVFWYDTLSMARAVYPRFERHSLEFLAEVCGIGTPKTVPYNQFRGKTHAEIEAAPGLMETIGTGCLHDITLTKGLFDLLKPRIPQKELRLIDHVIRMFTEPRLAGDRVILQEALEAAVYEKERAPERVGATKEALVSDKKFASLLYGLGVEVPMKISPRTGKRAFALSKQDKSFLALKEHPDGQVRAIIEARLACKTSINETRAARLLSISGRGAIPVYLGYYRAHTGRFGGGDKCNLQNLPRDSKLRGALTAPVGYALVWGDLSQIECRITAYVAGALKLLKAFEEERDVYSEFGTSAFGCPVNKKDTPDLRFFSKEMVLGGGFGIGKDKVYDRLSLKASQLPTPIIVRREVTDQLHSAFRSEYHEIPQLWKDGDRALRALHTARPEDVQHVKFGRMTLELRGRKVMLPNGLHLDYEDLHMDNEGNLRCGGTKMWGGSFTENFVQALARIVITDAWLWLEEEAVPIVLQVHDELVGCVPLIDCIDAAAMLEVILTEPVEFLPGLPLACEVGWGNSYGK